MKEESTQQLYSSTDLLTYKPPFTEYSREAVLYYIVHELKHIISIDEDYSVTIHMQRHLTENALKWGFMYINELSGLISYLKQIGYTQFTNTNEIAEYIQRFQLDSGFFASDTKSEEASLGVTLQCIYILKELRVEIPKKELLVAFILEAEAAEKKHDFPAIFDVVLPGHKRSVLCSGTTASTLHSFSYILHACGAEWANITEKFEWIESTWEDGVGYKMMMLQKIFFGAPPEKLPAQSTIVVGELYNEYNQEIPHAKQALKIFEKHKKIIHTYVLELYSLCNMEPPKRLKKKQYAFIVKNWYAETGGFTPHILPGMNTGTTEPLTANLRDTLSNAYFIEKYC